jgi:hypothetical protein
MNRTEHVWHKGRRGYLVFVSDENVFGGEASESRMLDRIIVHTEIGMFAGPFEIVDVETIPQTGS